MNKSDDWVPKEYYDALDNLEALYPTRESLYEEIARLKALNKEMRKSIQDYFDIRRKEENDKTRAD